MTVGILGLGLIGGSLARAYAMAGHRVLAWDTDESILSFAILSGAVDGPLTKQTLCSCQTVLLAVYPEAAADWLEAHGSYISRETLVMDCCGTKRLICNRCFPLAERFGFTFIGGHPMAGNQFSGFKYSRGDLFENAPMVLVPPRFDDIALLDRAKKALSPCRFGSFSVTTAQEHDKMIAFTSQMPHIVSNAYIKSPTAHAHKGFSAGSYKDLTRVAWLNPQMWAELLMDNKDNVIQELDGYIASLYKYRDAISAGDQPYLTALLDEGRCRKEEIDG